MTKMRFLGLVAIVVAAGCGSKSSDSAATSADTSACGGAIDSAMTSMMDARKKMIEDRIGSGGADPAKEAKMLERSQHVVDGLRSALTTRCTEDKWPAEVLACFGTVKKREEIKACLDKLPKDQADRATSEIMKTMTNGLNMRVRQGGSMPMGSAHGMPLVGGQPMGDPAGGALPVPATVTPTPAPAPAPAPTSAK